MGLRNAAILAAALIAGSAACLAQPAPVQIPDQNQTSQSSADQSGEAQTGEPQEYQGPSILSRDKSLIGERGGKLLDFRFYGTLTGVYDTGLAPVESNGNVANVTGAYGVEAGFGVIGSKTWRRDILSLEYNGDYTNYPKVGTYSGLNQFLNLRYAHMFSRRFTINTKVTAGTSNLANGFFTYLPLANSDLFAAPSNELFDNRTNFIQSGVDASYQKTARLSYIFGGQGFVVRRDSLALTGMEGYSAHGGLAYRLTRYQTVGLDYGYTHFDFQRAFGFSNLHTATLSYSVALGRRWEVLTQAGGTYLENRGLEQVTLSPSVAAILGTTTATVNFLDHNVLPYLSGQVVRRFARATANVSASTGVSPGNGIYLTSRATTASAGYSYVGLHRLTIGSDASYSELSSLGQSIGKYGNYQAGAGVTYKVANSTFITFRYDYRHYTANDDFYLKNSQRVTLGLAFSPGEKPLPIW